VAFGLLGVVAHCAVGAPPIASHPSVKPFFVTALQAAKMPRWLLLLMCGLYVVPGLVGRDPWRLEDAAGFGIAWTMATGEAADWLMPNVVGVPVTAEGPLPFWLGALFARLLPVLAADTAVRVAAMVGLTLLLVCIWYAAWMLARRPGVQPADPFGASATHVDYGRAIADSALLLTLATFGLLARAHETTAESAQVAWIGVFLVGCALALERPRLGGALAGLAIGLTALSRGLPTALALTLVALLLTARVAAFRLVARPTLVALLPVALVTSLAWPIALAAAGPSGTAHLAAWLAWNRELVAGPSADTVGYAARTLPWFFWPAWPLAAWAIWRWRERRLEPALAVPAATASALALIALLSPVGSESMLLPIVPAAAMLGALGLPTIRRGLTSLIDWFAVMTFTLIGAALWAYWIAFQTGWPPKMAYRAQQSVLGWVPTVDGVALAAGGLATVAWLGLVRWRVSRRPRAIWRSVILSAGGMVLAWCLLMTLWLPAGNYRKTYRDVAQQAGLVVSMHHDCVATLGLDLAQRATFAYFGGLRLDDARGDCGWLLVADRESNPLEPSLLAGSWRQAWRGQRPVDRQERFRLFRRVAGG
jgi:4-amino-4-deoxy-L-arabinose transferase-like glycosyltransferase